MTANDHGHINNLDQKQRDLLKAYWLALVSAINEDSSKVFESAMGEEFFYLCAHDNPDVILLRWLRARKWQITPAVQLMMDTLKWRHEWGVRKLMSQGESGVNPEECASSKVYYMGKDKAGRPVSYVHAEEHVRGQYPMEETEKCLILFMEIGRDLAEYPAEEGTVVLDMGNVGMKNLDYQYIKFMIGAMQNYYPECLGQALIVNAPWTFNTVWSVVRRWLDPVVESKIRFVKDSNELTEYIDPAHIPRRLLGTHMDFKYFRSTSTDQARLTTIRSDEDGMRRAQAEHREAAKEYLTTTLRWARGREDKNEEKNRMQATERLSTAYKQLAPYISTETLYHRTGIISKSAFDSTYERIRNEETQVEHF